MTGVTLWADVAKGKLCLGKYSGQRAQIARFLCTLCSKVQLTKICRCQNFKKQEESRRMFSNSAAGCEHQEFAGQDLVGARTPFDVVFSYTGCDGESYVQFQHQEVLTR